MDIKLIRNLLKKLSSYGAKKAFLKSLYTPGCSDIVTLFLELNNDLSELYCLSSTLKILKKEIVFAKNNNVLHDVKKYRKMIIDSKIRARPDDFYCDLDFIKKLKKWKDEELSNYFLEKLPRPKNISESERIVDIYKKLGYGDRKELQPLLRSIVKDYMDSRNFYRSNAYFLYNHNQYNALITYWLKAKGSDRTRDGKETRFSTLPIIWGCAKQFAPEKKKDIAKIVWGKYRDSWRDIHEYQYEVLYTECALELGYKEKIVKMLSELANTMSSYDRNDISHFQVVQALQLVGLQKMIIPVIKAYEKSYKVKKYPGAHSLEIAEMYLLSGEWKPRVLKKYYKEALEYRLIDNYKISLYEVEEICRRCFEVTGDNSLRVKIFKCYEIRGEWDKAVALATELGMPAKLAAYKEIQKLQNNQNI